MKRILLISTSIVALAVPAMAADLPVKAPPPVMAPLPTWTGFYLGLNGGYSWGNSRREVNFVTATGGIVTGGGTITGSGQDLEGGLVGGQIGYNWQTANWVLGIETDLQWAAQRGSAVFNCPSCVTLASGVVGTGAIVDQELEWFFVLTAAAYNLVRIPKLLAATG